MGNIGNNNEKLYCKNGHQIDHSCVYDDKTIKQINQCRYCCENSRFKYQCKTHCNKLFIEYQEFDDINDVITEYTELNKDVCSLISSYIVYPLQCEICKKINRRFYNSSICLLCELFRFSK